MAPFALEESVTLHLQAKKTKSPELLGEKFPNTFSQLLLEESRVLWGAARIFLQVAKHVTLLQVTEKALVLLLALREGLLRLPSPSPPPSLHPPKTLSPLGLPSFSFSPSSITRLMEKALKGK